jgi:hypothetical protein
MKELGNTIYLWGCVVAATILGLGVADLWFGRDRFAAFLSWVVLAAIPWLVGRACLYVLSRVKPMDDLPIQYRGKVGPGDASSV